MSSPRRALQLRFDAQFLRKRLPVLGLAVLLVVVGFLAVRHEGVPIARTDLNDGGVWVTNKAKQLVGNLNYDSRTFSGILNTESAQFDIAQSGNIATLSDESARSVASVDPAAVRLGTPMSLPERAIFAQGGDRLGILDAGEGNLWLADAQEPASAELTDGNAIASDLEGGLLTVATDGTVLAVAPESGEFVSVEEQGPTIRETRFEAEDVDLSSKLQLTAVGSKPVALDTLSNELILPDDGRIALSSEGVETGALLQQPGPDATDVLLATPTQLVKVDLDDHQVEVLPAAEEGTIAGRPARPARLNGCDYAAWGTSGAFLRTCEGDETPLRQDVETLRSATELEFRINRDLIVLNDVAQGSVWLPDKDMVLAANWDTIETELERTEQEDESPQVSQDIADPERAETNTPPIATDDPDLGVRPGQSVTLDVLANDSDPDGDVLTANVVKAPAFGSVWHSRGGQALRFDVPADATGSTSFDYEASDGLAVDAATATVRIVGPEENTAPAQRRDPGLEVGAQAEAEINILPHWADAESDRFFLSAVSSVPGLEVRFREEGTISVRDTGHGAGSVALTVTVADQFGASGQGKLTVTVREPGNLPPQANADFYVGRVNEPVLIQPLANDQDANNDTLTLVGASAVPEGASLTPDLDTGTLSFTATLPGAHAFTYTVTDGPSQSVGVVRVDVAAADKNAVPVAEDDVALLPAGGQVLVEPLSNDTEPSGGVLVVQSYDLPENSPLQVTLVDRHLLRISSHTPLREPTSFTYTVANGTQTAQAKVFVVPSAAQDDTLPPEVQPDRGRVRAGDIGSVEVLGNDRSPAGLTLRVDPELEHSVDPAVGTPFVTGNLVRFEAGDQPGYAHVSYTVRDTNGNSNSSTVTFEVVAKDAANSTPRPHPLTAWAVSGQTVRIPVPTAGIDPDGDSVVLTGIESPPQKGTAALGVDWIEYTPAPNQSGTDVFTYIVEDRLGKQATARVRVGIAQPATTNQPPLAVPDTVLVRPGRVLTVPVLANDLDPDGDELVVVNEEMETSDPGLAPQALESGVVVNSPEQPGSYVFSYQVSDGRGGTSVGSVTLNVMEDAPPQAPEARDDVVAVADLPLDGSPVEIDVLANDNDPDGDRDLLVLETATEGVTVEGNKLIVKPTEQRQLFTYTITDQDDLTGTAVVSVPGLVRERPVVDETKVPIKLRGGEELALDLRELVKVREGRTPRIAEASSVKASIGSDGAPVVKDDHTILYRALTTHVGPASISVKVADGQLEDRSTVTASLTIPLMVVPAVNQPPRLTPTPLTIESGGEPVAVDLTQMVDDPDQADPSTFRYDVTHSAEGVTARLEGTRLLVSAGMDRPKGPAGSIGIAVDDGSGVVSTELPVTITASRRPLVQLSDAMLNAAAVGVTERIDINQYAINPYPQQPLRITRAGLVAGHATVSPEGGVLEITPHKTGQTTVEYTVADASGDPDRLVTGRVRLIVRDRPGAPSKVNAMPTGPGSAMVTFTPGPDNGAEITGYRLREVNSGRTWPCGKSASACEIDGLAPGSRYSFSVTATNAVGESDPSAASAPILVDVAPGRPNPPTVTAGDGSVTVSWTPPTNGGSAITSYDVTLSGPGGRTMNVGGNDRSVTFTGLQNGASYSASVIAHNSSEMPSSGSAQSAAAIPFGVPGAPTGLALRNTPPESGNNARVEVSWQCGDDNGRPVDAARVTWDGGSKEIDGGCPGSTVLSVAPGESVEVSVAVHTEGGWSPEVSGRVTARALPAAISAPTVKATGENGEIRISGVRPVPGNGYRANELQLQYSVNRGSWEPLNGDTTLTRLTNGTPYSFAFRQVAATAAFAAEGPAVTGATATPYGPPVAPTLSATLREGNEVLVAWSYQPSNGGPTMPLKIRTSQGERRSVTSSTGSFVLAGSPGETITVNAEVCDSDGRCAKAPQASVYIEKVGTYAAVYRACRDPYALEPPLPRPAPTPTPTPTPSPEPSPEPDPSADPTDPTDPSEPPAEPSPIEPTDPPAAPNAPAPMEDPKPVACHTFDVVGKGWENQASLSCTFVSDIDGGRYLIDLRKANSSVASGLRTNLTDSAKISDLLSCKPG